MMLLLFSFHDLLCNVEHVLNGLLIFATFWTGCTQLVVEKGM